MYGISSDKFKQVAADERQLTIRAAKGSGEKPRYVLVQRHSDNWIGTLPAATLRTMFEAVEDRYLLDLIRTKGAVYAADQTFTAFVAWAESNLDSQRLSKEAIGAWFDADMLSPLVAALAVKGIADDKIGTICTAYKAQMQTLAAREVSMTEAIKGQLEKCLSLLPEDYESPIAERIAGKLAGATAATSALDAL